MPDCECITGCLFFNDKMVITPAIAEIIKRYCQTENCICARYLVMKSQGKDKVPHDLYPYQLDRAIKIIQNGNLPASAS